MVSGVYSSLAVFWSISVRAAGSDALWIFLTLYTGAVVAAVHFIFRSNERADSNQCIKTGSVRMILFIYLSMIRIFLPVTLTCFSLEDMYYSSAVCIFSSQQINVRSASCLRKKL